jgi:transcriptional regulator with XRE-family HTH domain
MSRKKSSRLLPTQKAVVELRKHRGMTQQEFSSRLGIAITTVARWETFRPPSGSSLARLRDAAAESGRPDLQRIFDRALLLEAIAPLRLPFGPLSKAVSNLITASTCQPVDPRLAKAYGQMLSALTEAHAQLFAEARAGRFRALPLEEIRKTQIDLEQIQETEQMRQENP